MLSKKFQNAMEMILNGGKEKFTINSKDLGVARDYKIDFEGISHFIKISTTKRLDDHQKMG
jgi:hypothetical protein